MAGYLLTLLAKEIVAVDTIEVLQVREFLMGWWVGARMCDWFFGALS